MLVLLRVFVRMRRHLSLYVCHSVTSCIVLDGPFITGTNSLSSCRPAACLAELSRMNVRPFEVKGKEVQSSLVWIVWILGRKCWK